MSDKHYRSSHKTVSSPSPKKRRVSKIIAVPVAVAAIGSIIFGTQSANAQDSPKLDKLPKSKSNSPVKAQEHFPTAPVLSDRYIVATGDTVHSIAQMHGVSSAELLAANGLSWKTMIFTGQQLHIPAQTNGTESAEVGESITRHIVVAGDTLEAISRTYSVQPRAIMSANGLDRSSRLVVGQKLVIPDAQLMSSMPAIASA